MDVRGTAPVFIPPSYNPQIPITQQSSTINTNMNTYGLQKTPIPVGNHVSLPPPTVVQGKRFGLKIKIAFLITVLFILLQLHPVVGFIDRLYGFVFMRSYELGNEYGCITMKGLVFSAILYFVLVLFILRKI